MAYLRPYDTGAGPISVFNLTAADSIQNVFLGTASAEQITVPTSAKMMLVRADRPFYYRINAAPVVPTTEITSAGSIYVPADTWEGDSWIIQGKPTTVRFIRATAVNTILTVLFYEND